MRTRVAVFVFWSMSLACSSDLPHPRYTGQPTSALTEIPYPPPPARVEMVPAQPVDGAVFVRGEWLWDGRRWAWKQGAWYTPPEGVLYARWVTVRGNDGKLYLASGTWRTASGEEVQPPPAPYGARSGSESVVNPEGENETVGPTIPADGGTPDGGNLDQDRSRSNRPGPR
jgi:hypothetical protein